MQYAPWNRPIILQGTAQFAHITYVGNHLNGVPHGGAGTLKLYHEPKEGLAVYIDAVWDHGEPTEHVLAKYPTHHMEYTGYMRQGVFHGSGELKSGSERICGVWDRGFLTTPSPKGTHTSCPVLLPTFATRPEVKHVMDLLRNPKQDAVFTVDEQKRIYDTYIDAIRLVDVLQKRVYQLEELANRGLSMKTCLNTYKERVETLEKMYFACSCSDARLSASPHFLPRKVHHAFEHPRSRWTQLIADVVFKDANTQILRSFETDFPDLLQGGLYEDLPCAVDTWGEEAPMEVVEMVPQELQVVGCDAVASLIRTEMCKPDGMFAQSAIAAYTLSDAQRERAQSQGALDPGVGTTTNAAVVAWLAETHGVSLKTLDPAKSAKSMHFVLKGLRDSCGAHEGVLELNFNNSKIRGTVRFLMWPDALRCTVSE